MFIVIVTVIYPRWCSIVTGSVNDGVFGPPPNVLPNAINVGFIIVKSFSSNRVVSPISCRNVLNITGPKYSCTVLPVFKYSSLRFLPWSRLPRSWIRSPECVMNDPLPTFNSKSMWVINVPVLLISRTSFSATPNGRLPCASQCGLFTAGTNAWASSKGNFFLATA